MRAVRTTLCLVASVLIAGLCAGLAVAGDQPAAPDEEQARQHYLLGEAAMRSGDVLTAVVEWQTTLRLKPSSAYTAKVLTTATGRLGPDGKEAYAHYVKTCDLTDSGKLDDAGKELGLALAYRPKGQTPKCLTAKALELAELQKKVGKPADIAQSAVAAPATTAVTSTVSTASEKTAVSTKLTEAKTKKTTGAAKTAAAKREKGSLQTSVRRVERQPMQLRNRSYSAPIRKQPSRLKYQHGYTINGKKIPGHYTIKPSRPRPLHP